MFAVVQKLQIDGHKLKRLEKFKQLKAVSEIEQWGPYTEYAGWFIATELQKMMLQSHTKGYFLVIPTVIFNYFMLLGSYASFAELRIPKKC